MHLLYNLIEITRWQESDKSLIQLHMLSKAYLSWILFTAVVWSHFADCNTEIRSVIDGGINGIKTEKLLMLIIDWLERNNLIMSLNFLSTVKLGGVQINMQVALIRNVYNRFYWECLNKYSEYMLITYKVLFDRIFHFMPKGWSLFNLYVLSVLLFVKIKTLLFGYNFWTAVRKVQVCTLYTCIVFYMY